MREIKVISVGVIGTTTVQDGYLRGSEHCVYSNDMSDIVGKHGVCVMCVGVQPKSNEGK